MHETCYNTRTPNQEDLDLHYMDGGAHIFGFKMKNFIRLLESLNDYCDFSDLDENQYLLKQKYWKIWKFNIETAESIYNDMLCVLGAISYSYVCSNNKEYEWKWRDL